MSKEYLSPPSSSFENELGGYMIYFNKLFLKSKTLVSTTSLAQSVGPFPEPRFGQLEPFLRLLKRKPTSQGSKTGIDPSREPVAAKQTTVHLHFRDEIDQSLEPYLKEDCCTENEESPEQQDGRGTASHIRGQRSRC
ncbi:hypothetical protein GE061_014443 [Apolygus lucorum]|uniref:Uncharacterized protein n=1 Tax=Apolygus lucorum TaxID=248454 RepID=A0A8S9XTA3_APOLU|nr:hypothetical protein GE061_014443 [Apolygus lucorum]